MVVAIFTSGTVDLLEVSMLPWKWRLTPKNLLVNKWKIDFVEFQKPHTKHKTPIIILGGAFSRFESFRRDVELLYQYHPVIIVELPGQGQNSQLAPQLNFEHYAHLLKGFIDRQGINKVIPIAMSSGSAIAYHFALHYPYNTERLILSGIAPDLRPSTSKLLIESLNLIENRRLEEFAQGVVLNMMNYPRRKEMRGSELLARGLYRNVKSMSVTDLERYKQNILRSLRDHTLPDIGPSVETMVMVGEWDHFTTPYENFKVARRCSRSVFSIVTESDHLAPFLKKEMVNHAYLSFLEGERLHSRQGLIVYRQTEYPELLRQMDPRLPYREEAFLEASGGIHVSVEVEDLNIFGCRLKLGGLERTLMQQKQLKLNLPSGQISLGLLPFREDALTVTALFKRTQFKLMHDMELYLKELAPSSLKNLRAA
jgi:pimeloyl-ACP methyl ester carboxylesterase